MEKGLFSVLFILTMLVLLSPANLLLNKNHLILDTTQQLNELSLAVDSIIADALSDETYNNSCSLSSLASYNSKVTNYINSFEAQRSNYSSIICNYSNLSSSLNSSEYIGTLDISCSSRNDVTSIGLTKKIYFKKAIFANSNPNWCVVRITDNYSTPPYIQVDLNKSS